MWIPISDLIGFGITRRETIGIALLHMRAGVASDAPAVACTDRIKVDAVPDDVGFAVAVVACWFGRPLLL